MFRIQRSARLVLKWAVVVSATLGAALLGSTAASAAGGPTSAVGGADLVVTNDDFLRVIHDESGFTAYLATVANPGAQFVTPGKGILFATAGPSTTRFTFVPVQQLIINGQVHIMPDLLGRPAVTKSWSTPALARGDSDVVGAFFSAGESVPSGRYRITVCADSAQTVAEVNETNNCRTIIRVL